MITATEDKTFVYTTAIRKLRGMRKRIKIVPGSTSAGKTYGILPVLIDRATRNFGVEISVISESIPHLRKGAMKDFLKIMKATGRFNPDGWNQTLLTYTFVNGSYIEFFSADQEEKVRGPRRHILYINEANNIRFETYHQLAIRTSREIWLDFNPSLRFWVHEELTDDEDAEWLETRAHTAPKLLNCPERTVRGCDGEEAGLGHDENPITCCPRSTGEGIE